MAQPVLDLPECVVWTKEEVAKWIEDIGYKQYKECFLSNFICGRKLIHVSSSTLPKMGITDWNHIKKITKEVRLLLKIEDPHWNRSITLPHRSVLGISLEKASFTRRKN